ncbi:DUF2935 domain-containing protein [Evansella sp. AB-P1]|uniref:DUF2935 domain-containing protein n=1 Tax=Evansella sp. AB-P1 TaxID=3037653 RepID=UPI0024204336|nr:DUF2935 domain-containing protein [Evansella sp. AB-P1]MDG5787460.1 DUF2935 domain-containing protein [Evansella sp. AB-P1]
MVKAFTQEAIFELSFWTQILGDHSRFILDALSPKEEKYIEQAQYFINQFDSLLQESRQGGNEQNLISTVKKAEGEGKKLRELKLAIIKDHLVGSVKITLSPSFLSHMVNELDEGLRVFSFLVKGKIPPAVHPLHHDLIWLLDAAGHAGAIQSNMDHVEYDLREKSKKFKEDWEEFYLKAIELAGFLRANVDRFPALTKFHRDIKLEMEIFKSFLRELEEMELKKENLSVFEALMADHMFREECYYLMKLSETTDLAPPKCDPTKPRTES